jgi:DNA-binding LacI/PurR family transcriptional regulator
VLNGRADVSARTRVRVEQAIDELGFAPRLTAQRLAGARGHTVSLLFPTSYAQRSNHELEFVLGAAEATSGRDYFFSMTTDPVTPTALRSMFRSGLVEGVILLQITEQDWRVDLVRELDLPCVLIGRTADNRGLSWIDFDFETAVGAMLDHLVAVGHRQIGFVGRPREALEAGIGAAVRLQRGYEAAARRLGLEPHAVQSDLDPLAAGQAALHLVDTVPGLTAVVGTHGPAAAGMLHALLDRGLSVPGDVSLMTVATERIAAITVPGMSGVPFPSARLGFEAASSLARQLDDRAAGTAPRVEQILLPAHVTLRGSAAPARSDR